MKKNLKQIIAIIALIAIAALIIVFIISAFFVSPDQTSNKFGGLLFGIIAIPILAWLLILCIGMFQDKNTIASFFPKDFFSKIFDKNDESNKNDIN